MGLIALNAALFVYELMLGSGLREFILQWGLVPARLTLALRFGEEPVAAAALTLFSSMFLHGGWLHLIGNMWYLWIFGDNVEDRMGSWRFLGFYLSAGFVAALLHSALQPGSPIPTVGASGAIAGVLGAYALAFPRARVMTLIPLFFFFQVVAVPALVVLGLWFVFQFIAGTMSLGAAGSGGVAWWAHIAGFAYGFVFMGILSRRQRARGMLFE
jgi:membrane associated rhomboid family serine protease